MKNKIQNVYKELHKIKIKNILSIFFSTIILAIIFEIFRYGIPKLLNIHLGLKFEIEQITIYSCILGLVLPLAIMLIEKINVREDYIIAETYLKNTNMFPIIIYFCTNLVILTFMKEQYYFIVTSIVSNGLILYMYYKTFKLLSDLNYENAEIAKTRKEIINNYLIDQIQYFNDSNIIKKYCKYGVKIIGHDYINISEYRQQPIYPKHNFRKIEQYNYRIIRKLVKILMDVNKEYISNNEIDSKMKAKQTAKPNIIIALLDIGETIQIGSKCATIYYSDNYIEQVKEIYNFLTEKIYMTSEENNKFYIKVNYEYLQSECVKAIESCSATLLSNCLSRYFEIYENYVDGISENIGKYSYETAYNHTHSIYEPKAYEILHQIRKDIIDYSQIILKQNNSYLMNELINFLYKMIIYSYKSEELLSIQYLHNLYNYLNYQALELNNRICYEKIKLEVFEFINWVKYEINLDNIEFCKDVLLVCNRTISRIMFHLSSKNEKYFEQYLEDVFEFIDDIFDQIEQIELNANKNDEEFIKKYNDILTNFSCNFFATLSYVVNNWEKKGKDISIILNSYKKYSVNKLTYILLETIKKDLNDRTYSWDSLEEENIEEKIKLKEINTYSYIIRLYCLLLNKLDSSNIKVPLDYQLSTNADAIIAEFNKLGNTDMIAKFNKLIEDINKEETEYIRNTPISIKKVDKFKENFNEEYYKNSELYNILKNTGNVKKVKIKEKGNYYLGLSNIINKTYFLEKNPNNKTIIWSNFENNFVNPFINSEEKAFSNLIVHKSTLTEESILHYFESNNLEYNSLIIFADYATTFEMFLYLNIVYDIPKGTEYDGLKSNLYINYKDNYIPIYSIEGLEEEYIYLFNIHNLGVMEKYYEGFEIKINDFYNNPQLIKKFMEEDVRGLDLQGEERKNHLLESVNIFIQEYVKFDDKNMMGIKFEKNNTRSIKKMNNIYIIDFEINIMYNIVR